MAKKNSRWAVNLTALVLAVGLLMGLFTGCPNGSGPNRPNESAQPNGQVQPTDPSIFKTDKHGKITGYKCAKEELPAHLVIPAKIENEEIKEIGWGAFEDCTGLRSISLPANLTEIGKFAFSGCTGLTSITLPASLTQIDESAFRDCTGLTSISLPANLTQIGSYAFYNCTGLRSISLPTNLTQMGWYAFCDCTGLTSVHLPANLTEIGGSAFEDCTGLTSAVFEDKEGWKVYDDNSYSGTSTSISSSDLADTSKAAKYLREKTDKGGYCNKYWKKN